MSEWRPLLSAAGINVSLLVYGFWATIFKPPRVYVELVGLLLTVVALWVAYDLWHRTVEIK